ncbi:MAG: HAD family phosphatase [Bacteroidales bacterium]|nr:HAD family phosphatase [Bacteroidales bacterium]
MIKNIIFDLGGVVLNIDYNRTAQEFKKLGLQNFDSFYSQAKQSHVFDLFEKGLITAEKFREMFRTTTGIIFCDMELDRAWNAMLLDLPKERVELLQKVKNHYKIFLLSNTNIIHYEAYTKQLQQIYGLQNLGELFHKEYYSHEIHLRKPEPECFQFVLDDQEILAEETLFIDDSSQHIKGANQLNIRTLLMDNSQNKSIIDLFNNEGKLK